MSNQIIGYYNSRLDILLKDFDRTCILIKDFLVERYGDEFAKILQKDVRQEYEKLIPEIPYIKGLRGKILNSFLLITAQELATYKAMKQQGQPATEAWELCHQALRLRVAQIPRWKRWFLRKLMFSSLIKKIMARRAQQQQKVSFGDFEVEYLIDEGDDFDLGVNYLKCGNYIIGTFYRLPAVGGDPHFGGKVIGLNDSVDKGLNLRCSFRTRCHQRKLGILQTICSQNVQD